ncbi:MAG: CPBP family intramembrane metalloprotease [Tannerella sp.]|nr:CPBP family intramembrane metalloprotease [Tannerella sp.]
MGLLTMLILAGLFTGTVIGTLILLTTGSSSGNAVVDPMEQSVLSLQSVQFVTAVFTFLIPALCTAWLCSNRPKEFLNVRAFPGIGLLLLVCITTLLLSPMVSLTGYFNSQMQLPESLSGLEAWMKSAEELANSLIRKIVSEKGWGMFLVNLFVIAVVAGVTEEFLFRGALFHILGQKINNHHVVIWLVAILFSAIHFQFYGFVPRMILGAYLGYLIYWTKNIWIPVFAHFFHNAIAFIGMSNDSLKDNAIFADEIAPEDIGWLSTTTCICLIAFFFCTKIVKKKLKAKS